MDATPPTAPPSGNGMRDGQESAPGSAQRARVARGPLRPAFAFGLEVPVGWQALRGDAASLRDDLVATVARTPVWAALTARQRAGTAVVLGQVAEMSARTGAVATVLRLGPVLDGVPQVGVVTLAWQRTTPVRAHLGLARLALPDGYQVTTGVGPGWCAASDTPTADGGHQLATQIVAPVPGTVWMAVLSGSTIAGSMAEEVAGTVRALASSLTVSRRVDEARKG